MAKATLSLAKKENKQGEHHILVRMDITRTNRPQFKSPVTVKEEEFVDGGISIPKRGKLNATYRESLMKKKTDIEAFVASLNAIIMSLPEEALTRKDILEVYEMVKTVNPSEISRTTIISKRGNRQKQMPNWSRNYRMHADQAFWNLFKGELREWKTEASSVRATTTQRNTPYL